ncbi:MAG TPA: ATPase, T2SS/T4P/T4SS family [Candidatus Paceibacterota bacterium]
MHIEEQQLKAFINDSGLVSRGDVADAEREAKEKRLSLGEILVNRGKLSEDDLRKMKAYILGIPYIDLKGHKIDFSVLSLVPEPIVRSHNVVAFKRGEGTLEVAMLNTGDLAVIDFIQKKVGVKILPRLTDSDSIKSALVQYQKGLKSEFGDLIRQETASIKQISGDLKKITEDLSVIRIVDTLLKHAIIQGASDIHLEPLEKELLVRYRIDGRLHDAMVLPKDAENAVIARIKMLSSLKLDEKRLPQDGRFKIEMNGEKISLRVSVLPMFYGEKIVMRLLRESVSGFTLEHLGFHGEALERIHAATKLSAGMILATGPAGSGKSTALYTLLDILNTPDVNISTVEDPVEYQMARVNQMQVRPDIGFTFASGLRSIVRQDPDIIMVGEIRDNETASLATNAALAGRLVLSTLPAKSASSAISRMIEMKTEPFLLASTVSVVIGQRLVRRLSDASKDRRALTKGELAALSKVIDLDRMLGFLKAEKVIGPKDGWDKVMFGAPVVTKDSDGYKGRIGIHEVLKMTPTLKELVLKGSTAAAIEAQAKKEGMMTLLEDGIFVAAQGLTAIEEVLRVVSEEKAK